MACEEGGAAQSPSSSHPAPGARSGTAWTAHDDTARGTAAGCAGRGGAGRDAGRGGRGSGVAASPLAPENRPVPYRGVFRRPPELVPYATTFDDGDPARPFDRYALTQKLGRLQMLPGLSTPVAGLQRHLPGADDPGQAGDPDRGADAQRLPDAPGLLLPGAHGHLHPPARLGRRCPQYDGYANDITVPGNVKNYQYPNSADGAHPLVPRPPAPGHGPERVLGAGGLLPVSDQYERAQLPAGRVRRAADDLRRAVQRRRLAALRRRRATQGSGATSSWSTACRGPR